MTRNQSAKILPQPELRLKLDLKLKQARKEEEEDHHPHRRRHHHRHHIQLQKWFHTLTKHLMLHHTPTLTPAVAAAAVAHK